MAAHKAGEEMNKADKKSQKYLKWMNKGHYRNNDDKVIYFKRKTIHVFFLYRMVMVMML